MLLFEKVTTKGIQAKHANKLRMQLAALDFAEVIEDIDLPGYRLHLRNKAKEDCGASGPWGLKSSHVFLVPST